NMCASFSVSAHLATGTLRRRAATAAAAFIWVLFLAAQEKNLARRGESRPATTKENPNQLAPDDEAAISPHTTRATTSVCNPVPALQEQRCQRHVVRRS